jgi:hypothetical protein
MKIKFLILIILVSSNNLYSKWTIYTHLNSTIKEWVLQGEINQDKKGVYWFYEQ